MCRTHRIWTLCLIMSAGVAGCSREELPTGPSELMTGVTLYEHANFVGSSAHVTMDVRDLKTFDGPCEHEQSNSNNGTTRTFDWNDCVSSIRVAPGWRVEAYRDDDFKGQSVSTMQDIPNLQLVPGSCEHDGLNDCITSVRVVRP